MKEIADSAHVSGDTFLYNEAIRSMAVSYISENENDKAIEAYNVIFASGNATLKDSIYLGVAYSRSGMKSEAKKWLSKSVVSSNEWLKYEIYKELGIVDSAYYYLQKVHDLSNDDFEEYVNLGLSASLARYYAVSQRADRAELKNTKLIYGILFVVILSILIIAGRYLWVYKSNIRKNVLIAQNLRDILTFKEMECSEAHEMVKSLLDNKVAIFDRFCQVALNEDAPAIAQKRINKAVNDFRKEFVSKSSVQQTLEELVNRYYNNIIADLKSEFPNLKELDYNIYLYTLLGFSSNTILFFISMDKIEVVYERRRRMKDRFKKLDEPKRTRFLKYIS